MKGGTQYVLTTVLGIIMIVTVKIWIWGYTWQDAQQTAIGYQIQMIVVYCITKHIMGIMRSRTGEGTADAKREDAPSDAADLPMCPCCHHQYVPITDISNHKMCPWCGYYV